MTIILSVLLISAAALLAQREQHKYLKSLIVIKDTNFMFSVLENKLKKLEELESKVAALSLKAGFKI